MENFKVQKTDTDEPLLICTDCRHITWNNMPNNDEVSHYYQTQYAGDHIQSQIQEDGRNYYASHALELAKKYREFSDTKENLTLVDFGCAWPVFIDEAEKSGRFNNIIGVEYDINTVEAGIDKGFNLQTPDQFFKDTPLNSIDIIRFSHVVEHMIDPTETFKNIEPYLSESAMIYITQPIFPLMKTHATLPYLKDSVYPEHLHFFTPLSLDKLLQGIGYKVHEMSAFQNEEHLTQLYKRSFDRDYATPTLAHMEHIAPLSFDKAGRYPTFFGDNVYLYATRNDVRAEYKHSYLMTLKKWFKRFS